MNSRESSSTDVGEVVEGGIQSSGIDSLYQRGVETDLPKLRTQETKTRLMYGSTTTDFLKPLCFRNVNNETTHQ